VNTFAWYKERCYAISPDHDPTDWDAAMGVAPEWGDKIPIGVIYRNDRLAFEDHFAVLTGGALVGRDTDRAMLKKIMEGYA
jgi:2-oxoglutarate ferredoxin oxidoreductase subunit beta